jgi:hypothetical protein
MTKISSATRSHVRERAKSRCEYCYLPERILRLPHQIDHIYPPRHGGTDEEYNLTWACYYCNHSKGTDIGTVDFESQERVWLFNPRQDDWDTHFEMLENGLIQGRTIMGRATARLLLINTPDMIEIRRFLIQAGLW